MKENNKQKINSIEKESKNRNTNVKMHNHNGNVKTMLLNMKKDVQKQNITDDENEDYGVRDQEIIRIAR